MKTTKLNIKKLPILITVILSMNVSSEYMTQAKMRCEVIYERVPKIGNRKMRGKAGRQYYEKFKSSAQLEIMSSETNAVSLIALLDISGDSSINKFFSQGCEINDSEFFCEYVKTSGEKKLLATLRLDTKTKVISVVQKSSGNSRISLENKIDGICN
tara:strand:- start:42 stop:512 length:471 start_codon:yes stop_codon:yes gene_type:complete